MKHKIDVLLHVLEEVSRRLDNSTISSLASLVASICTIGSDELNESPPKPSTMVFMADGAKKATVTKFQWILNWPQHRSDRKVYSLGISQHVLGIVLESGTFVSSNCPFYLLVTLRFPLNLYS
jgi:hypothetical protein